jgi:hypothetical protein
MVKAQSDEEPWTSIRQRLAKCASQSASARNVRSEHLFRVMLNLVEAIANSPCARVLHAWITHYDLCMVEAPAGCRAGGRIQITPLRQPKLMFLYKPNPRGDSLAWNSKPRTFLPIEDERSMTIARYGQGERWFEEAGYDDGLAKLEEILDRLGWFPERAVS